MNNSQQINCPICKSPSYQFKILKKEFILNELEKHSGKTPPDNLGVIDYKMYRCNNCSLGFSNPMSPGSNEFYSWITQNEGYYPEARWEWNLVIEYIKTNKIKSVLEVGCGDGKFLNMIKDIEGLASVGLDTTKGSVDRCREKGLEVYEETIESYLQKNNSKKFDLVISFHCLEHVDNPITFIGSQISLLEKDGKILASTPYTAIPGEQWYETLNYPPHHMTQWNNKSYTELAKQLTLKLKLFMPKEQGLKGRIANSLYYAHGGFNKYRGYSNSKRKFLILSSCLLNPIKTVREIFRHINREKINVFDIQDNKEIKRFQPVSYVVLTELSTK